MSERNKRSEGGKVQAALVDGDGNESDTGSASEYDNVGPHGECIEDGETVHAEAMATMAQEDGGLEHASIDRRALMESELRQLREAVRLRDVLLDEMQGAIVEKKADADRMVTEAHALVQRQERMYEATIAEKNKQIELLTQMIDNQEHSMELRDDIRGLSARHASTKTRSSNDSSDKTSVGATSQKEEKKGTPTGTETTSSQGNGDDSKGKGKGKSKGTEGGTSSERNFGITLDDVDEEVSALAAPDPVIDDFLLTTLARRDELQDQLYDLTDELVLTKTKLGSCELEKERALGEVRRYMRLLAKHGIQEQSEVTSIEQTSSNPASSRNSIADSALPADDAQSALQQQEPAKELAELKRREARLMRKESQRVKDQFIFQQRITKLEEEQSQLAEAVRVKEGVIAEKDAALSQVEEDKAALCAQIKGFQEQIERKDAEVAAMQQKNSELNGKVMHFEDEDAAGKVALLQEKIVALTETINVRDQRIDALTSKNEGLASEVHDLKAKVEELVTQVNVLDQTKAELTAALEELGSLKEEMAQSTSALATMQQENKALEKNLEESERANADLAEQFLSLEERVAGSGEENSALKSQVQQLQADLSKLEHVRVAVESKEKDMIEREKFCKDVLKRFEEERKRRRALHDQLMELRGNIRVHCRVRTVLPAEKKKKSGKEVVFASDLQTVSIESKGDFRSFEFDYVHNPDTDNEAVFAQLSSMVTSFIDGFNVCVMAYGQTGSGKTHTMLGPNGGSVVDERDGVIFRSVEEIFRLKADRSVEYEYTLSVTVAEIYNNKIRDLLSQDDGTSHDVSVDASGRVDVPTLTQASADSPEQVLEAINDGMTSRAKRATNLNEHSSRSHLVVSLLCARTSKITGKTASAKMHMVDLAGSENNKLAQQSGDGLLEAKNINKSLSALGDVMSSLSERKANPKRHIPYRNSTLTLMLKDAIGGNAKTLLLACVSPTDKFSTESINTLRFGLRTRTVERGRITQASSK